jgi:hypothetical protein
MKPSTPGSFLPLVLSTCAAALQPPTQAVLAGTSTPKVKVIGRNSAYYTQVVKDDQLFKVEQLVVYPDRPSMYVPGSPTTPILVAFVYVTCLYLFVVNLSQRRILLCLP